MPAADEDRLYAEINMLGFYPVEMDEAEVERIATDKPYLEGLFRREIKIAQLEGWCAARRRPARPEGALHHHARATTTRSRSTRSSRPPSGSSAPSGRCATSARSLLASLGDVTPTPWDTEREYPEEELGERIAAMMDQVPERRPHERRQLPQPALRVRARHGAGARREPEARSCAAAGRASCPSAARPSATRSSATSRRSACTATSTSRAAPRRSARRCASTRAATTRPIVLRGAIVDLAEDGSCIDFLFTAG